jgi:hypothetical protein
MASQVFVNQIRNQSGFGTIFLSDSGISVSGIVSATAFSGDVTVAAGSAAVPSIAPTGDNNTGVFFPSPDTFAVTTGGSERIRVDSSGRLAIGTTSPSDLLTLRHGSDDSFLRFRASSQFDTGTVGHAIDSRNTALSATTQLTFRGNPLTFWNNGEAARIDSSNRLLIGTTSSLVSDALIQAYKSSGNIFTIVDSDSLGNNQYSSFVAYGGAREAQIGVYKHSSITNPCAYLLLKEEDDGAAYLWTDNSGNFRISSTLTHIGTTSGTVVGAQTSDERIKNILGPVEYGLDTLKQIEPVRYSLKSEPEIEKLGFIAQQVQPLVPQSVFDTGEHIEGEPEDAPTKLGMEYVALIPVLVNAIKELSAEVDALKAQLQAL